MVERDVDEDRAVVREREPLEATTDVPASRVRGVGQARATKAASRVCGVGHASATKAASLVRGAVRTKATTAVGRVRDTVRAHVTQPAGLETTPCRVRTRSTPGREQERELHLPRSQETQGTRARGSCSKIPQAAKRCS